MLNLLRDLKNSWKCARKELIDRDICRFKSSIIFDVGANNGSNFLDAARLFPWIKVHAFEPTPELITQIKQRSARLKNYTLIPKAVGKQPGTLLFNIAGLGDWGCSSLLEFSDDLEKTWPSRDDLRVTKRIQVEVITLEDYILSNEIEVVDFLHVDTQGTDLDVLKSLGSAIGRVRAGMIEVPDSVELMLYKGQHTRSDAMEFLSSNGFGIWKETHQQNESNLYFRRSAV